MKDKNFWKTISSKIVYENKYFKVREDKVVRPDETNGEYFVIEKDPSVYTIPLTENREIYLVGQYRYTTQKYSWELPGGSIEDENFMDAAKRELKEETGLISENWQKLGSFYPFSGSSSNMTTVLLARDVKKTKKHEQKDEGINKIIKVSIEKAVNMVKSGEINDGETIACLMLLRIFLNLN